MEARGWSLVVWPGDPLVLDDVSWARRRGPVVHEQVHAVEAEPCDASAVASSALSQNARRRSSLSR